MCSLRSRRPPELLLGALVVVTVLTADVRGAIGFSSLGVLVYYGIANASAWTLPGAARRWLRPLAALGLLGCLVLALSLPLSSVVAGTGVLVLGLAVRAARRVRRRRTAPPVPDRATTAP